MTPDKLPEEITNQINSEADLYGFVIPYDGSNTFYIEDKVKGYQAGATAWAGWKVKHDELQATIDDKIDKVLHAERNKMQAKITGIDMDWINRAQGLVDALEWIKTYGPADDITVKFVNKALREFKDGKEVEPEVLLTQAPNPELAPTCMECKRRPATIDYNGHGFYVCKPCDDSLNKEFDEEYK